MYLLGYDLGTSSIKATLLDAQTGKVIASATSPQTEMPISSPQPGWAEQDPENWWQHVIAATQQISHTLGIDLKDVKALGIAYQMHGCVTVDKNLNPIRPAIIWCDSRCVEIGNRAFNEIGPEKCLKNLLNSPGNFTASKLKWIKDNEPDNFKRIYKMLLPGDFIALKLTGRCQTTSSGLSEGILWNFQTQSPAQMLLDYYGIPAEILPETVPVFSTQAELTTPAASQLGLTPGIPVAYRAGDQPNNALSLNVLEPGEIAATAGTSGVIYGLNDQPNYDPKSRVNTFVHVNHTPANPRYGVLLCVNGTGCLNSFLKRTIAADIDYSQMNELAAQVPVGSEGLSILPYGNGAERSLENLEIGASFHGLNFNIHDRRHILRAGQEGIVFALNYGLSVMKQIGIRIKTVKAGDANMFLSPVFASTFATLTGATVELYNTDGAQGAARGAGIGVGIYSCPQQAFAGLKTTRIIHPDSSKTAPCQEAYRRWFKILQKAMKEES